MSTRIQKSGASLECGDLSPLWSQAELKVAAFHFLNPWWDQSADKSAHSKEASYLEK